MERDEWMDSVRAVDPEDCAEPGSRTTPPGKDAVGVIAKSQNSLWKKVNWAQLYKKEQKRLETVVSEDAP
ncbi:hypothetical protein RB195_000089 [Necator americanus]|uniref:Uncharacterized protein n=1 Tax=Necator americanus TaxID=51031 RepID=A0ABR1D7W6_NECAM